MNLAGHGFQSDWFSKMTMEIGKEAHQPLVHTERGGRRLLFWQRKGISQKPVKQTIEKKLVVFGLLSQKELNLFQAGEKILMSGEAWQEQLHGWKRFGREDG